MHTEYLEAKRSVDDRSINLRLWNDVFSTIESSRHQRQAPLRIAELGAGSGTMLDRLDEWGVLSRLSALGAVEYHAWEQNDETANALETRLSSTDRLSGRVFQEDVTEASIREPYDLVIAHAVLDLFTPSMTAALLSRFLKPGALLYAPIVFDGLTVFEPSIDGELDARIVDAYHRSMVGGFARYQIQHLSQSGFTIRDVAASDWIVAPRPGYPRRDDIVVVSTVLDMLETTLRKQIDGGDPFVTAEVLTEWVALRRRQLSRGELFFEAHQCDIVAQR